MADHGASFHAGYGRRDFLAGQGRPGSWPIEDIALIPLFIKVPEQRKGLVSDAAVQTIDIMPTVLRVLGDEPPGDMPGRVLLNANGLAELPSAESHTQTIRHWTSIEGVYESIAVPPDLPTRLQKAVERKFKIFGRDFSWETLRISDQRHAVLLGKRVKDFTVRNSSGTRIYLTSDPFKIRSNRDWLPQALIEGVVKDIGFDQDLELAIVANGVVQAVVPLIELDDTLSFSALLPLAAFDEGAPDIEFFLIRSEADGAIALETFENSEALAGAEKYILYLGNPKGPTIVSSNDGVIRIVDGALRGYIGVLTQDDKQLFIMGWAVEPKARQPAERILFFLDGDYLFWVKPSHARPGAARWAYKDDSIADDDSIVEIGYKVVVPVQTFPGGPRGELRAYAVSGDGRATELNNAIDSSCEPNAARSILWPFGEIVRRGDGARLLYDEDKSTHLELASSGRTILRSAQRENCTDLLIETAAVMWENDDAPMRLLLFQNDKLIQARSVSALKSHQSAILAKGGLAVSIFNKRLPPASSRTFSAVIVTEKGRYIFVPSG